MKWTSKLFIVIFFIASSTIGVMLYKEKTGSKFFCIEYSYSHAPYVKTHFNDIPIKCLIDTGSNGGIDLHPTIIHQLNGFKYEGITSCKYANGDELETKLYRFKNIHFLDLKTKNSLVAEIPPNYNHSTTASTPYYNPENSLWEQVSPQLIEINEDEAIIGTSFLRSMNFLLDFNKASFKIFKKNKLPMFSHPSLIFAKKIKIERNENGLIICNLNTSNGRKSFLLDTACTVNKLFSQNENEINLPQNLWLWSDHLIFKNQIFYTKLNKTDHNYDGVLGAEFFYNKVLFFDMDKLEIYFLSL